MTTAMVNAWDSDNSQFHARRRACLSGAGKVQDRVAVLIVDGGTVVDELVAAVAGQPIELQVCADAAEALLLAGRMCPDVIIVGPSTGRLDPIDFLAIVRADDPQVPVIIGAGTGSGDLSRRANDAGASAVVPRPYRIRELLALVNSLAPPTHHTELRPMTLELGRLRIDGVVPQMWLDDRRIELPPMEFLLLRFLAERAGSLVTRQDVLAAVWGPNTPVTSNTLSVHVMRLRRRLGDDEKDPVWIRAVRGLGYQFNVPAR